MLIYRTDSGKELHFENGAYSVQSGGRTVAWFTVSMMVNYLADICTMVTTSRTADYNACVKAILKHMEESEHETV